MRLSRAELIDARRYLRTARDNVADVRDLIGADDRHQAARLGRIKSEIEAEIAVFEKKIAPHNGD